MRLAEDLTRAPKALLRWLAATALLAIATDAALAGFIDNPVVVSPGAVRPSGAHVMAPAVDGPEVVAAPQRPGAIRPGLGTPRFEDQFDVDGFALAGVVDLPDAARPGAIRPGEDRRQTPPQPPGEVFAVPPLIDRPLDIDDGEAIEVRSFVLEGVVDRPEFDIETGAVQSLLDGALAARPEGFTVGRLQEVADAVTQYYREHGLIIAQAFVPVQEVADGSVTIQVMEGLLGQVLTEGNEMYKSQVLTHPLEPLVGQPVTKDAIESALLTVSDYPGQSAFGVLQPGVAVGTADMVVKVQEEKKVDLARRFDTHGITETGRNRYLGRLGINNLTEVGDQATLTVQQTAVPDNTFFYNLEYYRPLPFLYDSVLGLNMNRNQFDVGGDFRDSDISSDIRNYQVSLKKTFIRSRQKNLSAGFNITKKRSGTKASGRRVNLDSLAVASFELGFDQVDTRFAGLNAGLLEISHGFNNVFGAMSEEVSRIRPTRQGGNGEFAQGKFDKVLLSLSRFQALSPA